MSNIDPQTTQQIVQFLATYGTPAGIAAAQAVGTGAVQAVGSGATNAIKGLWGKIRHKSEQEGGIVEVAVTAFEDAPNEPEHQQTLSFVLKQLCSKDAAFAYEIRQLFNDVQRDPVAGQFIQHISGNAQVGVAGVNYGHVNIHQTTHKNDVSWQEDITATLNEFVFLWTISYGNKDEKLLIDPFLSELQRKLILISGRLITLLSRSSRNIPKEVISNISGIAGQLETLGRMQFEIDGGLSVNKFNELGDDIEKDAANLIDQINETM